MVKLSLCVIVGKKEAPELERLLKSVQGPLFDEIVVTTTQDDADVKKVAVKYSDKTPHFDWVKDFSAARNYCFNQASGDYIMWLDSDDEITPPNYKKLLEIKPTLQNYATVMLSYNYGHSEDGNPSLILPRERIVKNMPELRWQDPIHEYIPVYSNLPILNRYDIAVDHRRQKDYSADRNLEILSKVYEEGKASPRIKFYYGKDLLDSGKIDEALKVFNEYLAGPTDFDQNKAVACIRLGEHYMSKKEYQTAVMYMRRGLMFHQGYAELYYAIGVYYREQKDYKEAVKYFHNAASRNPEGLFAAKPDFYKKFPLDALLQVYYTELKDYNNALQVSEEFLKHFPEDKNFLFNRVSCINAIAATNGTQVAAIQALPQNEPDQKPKIAWLLRNFDPTEPSQRIRRLNVHVALQERGVDSTLMTDYTVPPPEYTIGKLADRNILVFSSFGPLERTLMEQARAKGMKVIFDLNEAILDIQEVRDTIKMADAVICCSKKLLEMAKPHAKLLMTVEDAAEPTEKEYNYFLPVNDKPTALYIGMGGNSFLANEYLKSTLDKAGYKLVVCSEWDNADVKWSLDTWEDTMLSAHVILCPQRVDVQPAKSNIKAAQAMSMGIPVIASPLPAYKEMIKNGNNGYLCDTLEDWSNALIALKDVKKRIQVGMNGKETAESYSLSAIAQKWEQAAGYVLNRKAPVKTATPAPAPVAEAKPVDMAVRQTVPIIIPVYNGVEYLKACISSIHLNTTYPYHIILSDAGSNAETWEYLNTLKGITVVGKPGQRRNFSEACNAGIAVSGSPRFIALLNSDVIVSKGWLEPIIQKMESVDRLAACGVLSNCDRGWLNGVPGKPTFPMRLEKAGMELVPGMKYDRVMPHLDELNEFMAKSNKSLEGKYLPQQWVAAYATVFAKSALDDVGHFDPIFKNGCEDLDLCRRLSLMGYNIGQALDSFIFHFGGISRSCLERELSDPALD